MKFLPALVAGLLLSFSAHAAEYTIDHTKSSIRFSGKHAGNNFTGTFDKWKAKIVFDPNNLAASHVEVTIDTSSAKTGNSMYDGTLPTADWFDVKTYPEASFVSETIKFINDNRYQVKGLLTLRGVPLSVDFVFTLNFAPGKDGAGQATVTSSFILDRIAYGIGVKSDPKAEWVDRSIKLDLNVVAAQN